jgi:DNA-binding NarL/FixJ family response regulator
MARQDSTCVAVTDGLDWVPTPQHPDRRVLVRTVVPKVRVLLIQADSKEAQTFANALRSLHIENLWARTGMAAFAATRAGHFDLLFVDLDLPDIAGTTVIKRLRAADPHARIIVVTATVTPAVTREALYAGALGVLGKPLNASDVIGAVHAALGRSRAYGQQASDASTANGHPAVELVASARPAAPRSTAERWAVLMLSTIRAEADPKTINSWARAVGVSRSVLCECCRLIHVSPHSARDFARLMRVICCSGPAWQPETLLDLADARTLKKLLIRAGLAEPIQRTPTLSEFFEAQQWISQNNPGLAALRALLMGGTEREGAPGRGLSVLEHPRPEQE